MLKELIQKTGQFPNDTLVETKSVCESNKYNKEALNLATKGSRFLKIKSKSSNMLLKDKKF